MKPKLNEHSFSLLVKTTGSKKSAELAVLLAFSTRKPDGCEFFLMPIKSDRKKVWISGAKSGVLTGFELVERSISNLRKTVVKI